MIGKSTINSYMVESTKLDGVKTAIKIGDKVCDYESLELKQSMYGHSEFTIVVNYKTKDKSIWAINPDELIKQQLGEKVRISIKHLVGGEEVRFYGYITDIIMGGKSGDEGHVTLKGGSPTMLLDRDKSMDYYTDCSLAMIAADVLQKSGMKISFKNKVSFNQAIPYICRYKETSYAFLARLFRSYGEWFYYDIDQMILGNPYRESAGNEVRVAYDVDIQELTIKGSLQNLNASLTSYNPDTDSQYNEVQMSNIEGQTLSTKAAKQKSEPIYPTQTVLPVNRKVISGADSTNANTSESSRQMTELSCLEGKSRTCKIQLGTLIVTRVPDTLPGMAKRIADLGRYRVVEITHYVNNQEQYSNEFKGIPGSAVGMAMGDAKEVVAYPELAKVVENEDPKHLGRVKVKFYWQEYRPKHRNVPLSTGWISVQTPDAGSSDVVSKNRGMLFIPEVGDMVMIGYEQGDPSRPFVMGSMFNMKNAAGAATKNNLKSIRTKSGHTIEFNDDERSSWGITIKDKEGNKIHIDTKGKNIEITAPETMTLNAKNLTLNVQENMSMNIQQDLNISVQKNVNEEIGENHTLQAKNETHTINENVEITASKKATIKATEDMEMAGSKMKIEATDADMLLNASGKITQKGGDTVDLS